MDEQKMRTLLEEYVVPLQEQIVQQSAQIQLLKDQLAQQGSPIKVQSVREAAAELGWSEPALRKAIDAGEFRSGDEVTRKGKTGSIMIDTQAYLRRKKSDQRRLKVC